MRKFSLIICIFFIFTTLVIAQEDNEKEIPEGMEVVQSGTAKLLVPKGARVTYKKGLIMVEEIGAYVGRRFIEMEKRLARIEASTKAIEKELAHINNSLIEMQKQDLSSQEDTEEKTK